tara:strand:- start:52 stop:369 length:318 start_codon:yes stop_codon:yes gene_type:complete
MFKKCAYRLFHKISIFDFIQYFTILDIKKEAKIWVIQKNTEEEEKSGQKKEEREKEIRKNNQIISYARSDSNKKIEYMDIFSSIISYKPLLIYFSKSKFSRKYTF